MSKVSKIKINLASGAVLEKPLITCFKGTNGNYAVLDNEANGSMGLPIIIISKLNGSNFEKILDPNEWGAVKDNLKTIIGGTALPYLAVPEEMNAPDDFFTQLTLPVASYDLLKKVYAPAPVETPEEPAAPAAPVAPAPVEAPTEPAPAPATPEVPAPVTLEMPAAPAAPEATPAPAVPEAPVIEAPVIAPAPVEAPAMPEAPVAPAPAQAPEVPAVPVPEPAPAPVAAPEIPVTPNVANDTPAIDLPVADPAATDEGSANPDIALIKETFMKSCENMFDALLKKFNK